MSGADPLYGDAMTFKEFDEMLTRYDGSGDSSHRLEIAFEHFMSHAQKQQQLLRTLFDGPAKDCELESLEGYLFFAAKIAFVYNCEHAEAIDPDFIAFRELNVQPVLRPKFAAGPRYEFNEATLAVIFQALRDRYPGMFMNNSLRE